MAVRAGDFKLVRYDGNVDTLTGARNQPPSALKLYNLATDIGETRDLAAALPEKVRELQAKWEAWNTGNVRPLWGAQHLDGGTSESGAAKKRAKKKTSQP